MAGQSAMKSVGEVKSCMSSIDKSIGKASMGGKMGKANAQAMNKGKMNGSKK